MNSIQFCFSNSAISKKDPWLSVHRFTTGLAMTLIIYEKRFIRKKECTSNSNLMVTRLSLKRSVAFRPYFAVSLALLHNGRILTQKCQKMSKLSKKAENINLLL